MNVNVTTNGGASQIAVGSSNVVQVQNTPEVTDEALRGYVRHLFESQVDDIENSTVWEMAEQYFGYDLSMGELDRVFKLISTSEVDVHVSWRG